MGQGSASIAHRVHVGRTLEMEQIHGGTDMFQLLEGMGADDMVRMARGSLGNV